MSNVLFIMCDQLRWDHLSCYGHPYLQTPNIDALAARGVRFERAFVNSGVCGPSRMSYYTGRYPCSHRATWNRMPLPVDEVTLGEYLRDGGRSLALAGKTHVWPDVAGLDRLHIDGESELGVLLSRGGFVEADRYDGHHEPHGESGYPAFLQAHGYAGDRPWHDYVISALDADGGVVSGWSMRNVHLPARVSERHSETAYMTTVAMNFMERMGDAPWVLHLSYVKPHWPYVAPSPYHAMYKPDQCLPVVRNVSERRNAHPVVAAYRQHEESISFSSDECIRTVRPAYQGLIKQVDDHLGRLFEFMESKDLLADTLIIFTSDHGDFLGDHWLGEKELFYDTVQRVPLIVVDPSEKADTTRNAVDRRFVESVDIAPTILDFLGSPVPRHRIEGVSLLPQIRNDEIKGKTAVYSELDYSFRLARALRGKSAQNARAYSMRTDRWRYVYWLDEPEQLFDLQSDPNEFVDLGREATHQGVREQLRAELLDWLGRRKRRTTLTDEFVDSKANRHKEAGVFFGVW
ncbi:arylsulfatase A-like enzyme [Bradyrhizobium sp. AZCC 1719]|uniref:sulfatase-like hydrolase/transferase n=1 Tax=Bradyrhizobium sp. AZCC 1719 TaxID=3117028 RepID=UPI002FF04DE6